MLPVIGRFATDLLQAPHRVSCHVARTVVELKTWGRAISVQRGLNTCSFNILGDIFP